LEAASRVVLQSAIASLDRYKTMAAQDRTYPPFDQIEDHDTVDLTGDRRRYRNICLTLPFPCKTVPWHVCEIAREQAKHRWSWFANAEQLDKIRATDMGTLGYLPWELRRQILTASIFLSIFHPFLGVSNRLETCLSSIHSQSMHLCSLH